MSAVAPFSPATSPVISSPFPPMINATPPPLLQPSAPSPFNSPPSPPPSEGYPDPSVTSPTSSVPPPALPPTVPLPTNPAPPSNPPATQVPPVISSPPPGILLVLPSSPPIPSNENPNPQPVQSPPSPITPTTPAVSFPSPETPASPPPPLFLRHRKVAPVLPSPTATSPPPSSLPALPEAKPPAPATTSHPSPATFFPSTEPPSSPRAAAAPTSPTVPEFSPEMNLPPPPLPAMSPAPPPSSESLPVAVEVGKHSEFNISSGLIVGIVTVGIFLVLVVTIVLVLCRKSNKKKQKNLYKHQAQKPSPYVGSKGSHFIRLPSNNDRPRHADGGGGAFGSVNSGDVTTVPINHAPSIALGAVNGIFAYDELIAATNSFSEANLLGEGGFGYVYKGVLPCGKEIAVKQLKIGSQQGEREFQAEVETISRVHHKHLVKLVGYCVTRAERLLVYEFVPNNTMEFHLHGEGNPVVEWEKRIKIALGSAKGLAYLHEDCNPAIIHRDIKASNILLDFNFEVKVSDFGLAKIFHSTDSCVTHLTTRVVGTFGYLAPEYASSGKLTDKSDVYSYGVMLLELITGHPPITAAGTRNESLVDWARPLLAQALQDGDFNNLVDPRLQKNYEADEMARMITCAAACVHHSARLRPRMSQIVGALEGMVSLTDLVGDITPGQTTLYSWSDSSNYDASQYQQDLRNFNLALSFQKYSNTSGHSEGTSAYGLHLSDSSSEVQHTSQDI